MNSGKMRKLSHRHFALNHYAFSKHSILQQLQHFLSTINRMTHKVLVPNLLHGMQRPGWSNTDLLHMYQVLNQVDHLLRWGNGQDQTASSGVSSNSSRNASAVGSSKESDLTQVLDTLERLSMDGRSSAVGSKPSSSNLVEDGVLVESKRTSDKPTDDDDEDDDDDDDGDDKDVDDSDKSDDATAADQADEDFAVISFESLLVRCRECRSNRNHRSGPCKRCVRSLMRMRKRVMKKSSRLVRRIVRTHQFTITQLFSQPNLMPDQQRSDPPLDQHLHDRLQFHLQQLTCILNTFSESAEQITQRYQTLIDA
jgi:hypothetical protein